MDEDRIFPAEWNWERYEPVMREWMAQRARIAAEEERGQVHKARDQQCFSNTWLEVQIEKGDFPPLDERERHYAKYRACLDRLYKEVEVELQQGRLRIGKEHLSRRNVWLATRDDNSLTAEELLKLRPEDLNQTFPELVKAKVRDAFEELEVKMLERNRHRSRRRR